MTFETLLQKLLAIEAAAAQEDLRAVRALTIEAEDMMLRIERDLIERLERAERRKTPKAEFSGSGLRNL
jgi:hypothetical protein